ncbi:MAG TPA: 4-hydroxy-tetrahydrodipicolinate synthase [Candidatus Copromorpha excrementigallinarum]|uniref:4-hydroxy-tetrahydrodipicolinate synthase n=1 Tax=Candidatus Allocopromorpha excrementigallinarum TaxID=2840742 RepID=A0A9D1L7F2_9FIRM|nr:4-hydroxy-tetrahydrodipicolinate synthase [Candidatus Copromorpha excrementigallinarum]
MIRGSIVALITPFNEDGSVNYKKLRELIDWHVDQQTDGILVLGTTAETPTLTLSEEDEIARIAIEQARGRVPVIVGSGSNNTNMAVEQSIKYEKMGADALLVITPYYNKASKSGMVYHFTQVADAVHTPIYVYNVPGRTGVAIGYDALAEISQHENIVGIKEASGNMAMITQFAKLVNDNFNIYSGDDGINIPILSVGGAGVISVLANILPRETHEMAMSYLDGDVNRAREMQLKYLDFINSLFIETNPIPIKEAMNMVGMDVGGYRMPLCPMAEDTRAVLKKDMEALGLL